MCARRIILYSTTRAEYGLVKPILNILDTMPEVQVYFTALDGMNGASVKSGWGFAEWTINEFKFPDIALVPCDRPEMVGIALYLFYHNVPFAQLHAGDLGSGTHDEIGRWIISRCASLHFCNSPESAQNLVKSGEETWRVYLVGSTAFENIAITDSISPHEPFDLLLIHPNTFSIEETEKDVLNALSQINKLTVLIGPNKDTYNEIIHSHLSCYHDKSNNTIYYPNGVAREEFLGLMKNCARFITNSSSALYELPAFDITKYLPIGKRNADRKPLEKIETGGAQRIARILATVQIDERLLRKKFVV